MGSLPAEQQLTEMIQELEAAHTHLKEEISSLILHRDSLGAKARRIESKLGYGYQRNPDSVLFYQRLGRRKGGEEQDSIPVRRRGPNSSSSFRGSGPDPPMSFIDKQYLNILEAMGQSIHIFDPTGLILYWNRSAERVYGYSATDALDQNIFELLVDPSDFGEAHNIIERITMGYKWSGQFPIRNKQGILYPVAATSTPFCDDNGSFVGILCVSCEAEPFREMQFPSCKNYPFESCQNSNQPQTDTSNPHLQPLQVVASKISNLASRMSNKVRAKLRTSDDAAQYENLSIDGHCYDQAVLPGDVYSVHREKNDNSSGAITLRGDKASSLFGVTSSTFFWENSPGKPFNGDEGGGKFGIHNIITSRAKAWINKNGISHP